MAGVICAILLSAFCLTGNAAEAARLAGYSEKYANRQGYALLQNQEIRTAINARLDDAGAGRLAEIEECLETLTRILRGQELDTVVTPAGKVVKIPVQCVHRLKAIQYVLKVRGAFDKPEENKTGGAELLKETLLKVWERAECDDGSNFDSQGTA